MALSSDDTEARLGAAIAALRDGDAALARERFAQLVDAGFRDAAAPLGLAYACQALGDAAAAMHAVDSALALDPRQLRALMLKAELLEAAGDIPAATAFCSAVLDVAAPAERLPPELRRIVERAETMSARHGQRFETLLRRHVDEVAARTGARSERFAQSLDMLTGRRTLFESMPRLFHFAELPSIQFHDRDSFPWLAGLEAASGAIRDELLALLPTNEGFEPYLQRDPSRPAYHHLDLADNPDWSAFYLWRYGRLVEEHAARCPATMAALEQVPLARVPGRSPTALFSLLRPGAHIPPHHGFVNTRLIVHLPLVVPPGCAFRVGNETREWVEGRAWVFDDTIEHEAWNRSAHPRVVLLFEVWRPELSADERTLVSAMFEAIDRAGGGAGDWGL